MNSQHHTNMILFASAFVITVVTVPAAWAAASKPAKQLTIVADGAARAVIVTAAEPTKDAVEAAEGLQSVVRQMTGVELAVTTADRYDGKAIPIFVGPSQAAEDAEVKVQQDVKEGDHYIVRTTDRFIALVGNDDQELQGTGYAVYDLLQRLGCAWFDKDPLWHVIPKRTTLTINAMNVDERPDFLKRSLWAPIPPDPFLRLSWRLNGREMESGHNLERLLPRKDHVEEHPEYFGGGQPCVSHPDVIDLITKKLRSQLDKQPGRFVTISLSPNDNPKFCRDDRSKEIGNNSANMMYFANELAKRLRNSHPGRFAVNFLAYWVTHSPPRPMIKGEPEVNVMIVNEGCHVHPVDILESPEVAKRGRNNTREVRDMAGWVKTGSLTGVYEWWIPTRQNHNWKKVPWYSGNTALRNIRYWKKQGIKYVLYEAWAEDRPAMSLRWPHYYVAARGLWDSKLTSRQIWKQACRKLYGPAARHMFGFYKLLETTMIESDVHSGNWSLPAPEDVYTSDAEIRATRILKAAVIAAKRSKDPKVLKRVLDQQKMWRRATETMIEASTPEE